MFTIDKFAPSGESIKAEARLVTRGFHEFLPQDVLEAFDVGVEVDELPYTQDLFIIDDTAESELVVLSAATQEAMWTRGFLDEIGFSACFAALANPSLETVPVLLVASNDDKGNFNTGRLCDMDTEAWPIKLY